VTNLALSTDETLLILKLAFLVLLYGFIVLIVRTATKDIGGVPQESIILGASEAAALRAQLAGPAARFVVLDGPGLRPGTIVEVTTATVVGRDPESGIRLDGDDFASAQHAQIGSDPNGAWVEDLGSTNGTFVNGARVTTKRALQPGDVVRVGQTELQLER
jgi:pSer/pThr/pTyr-binding forkhead associated (FHA) protein